MKLVLAVAALALVAASASAKCVNPTGGDATDTFDEGNVGLCTWYKDESCCNYSKAKEESEEKEWDDQPCEKSDGCKELALLAECATCSPETDKFIKVEDGKVKITLCKAWANRLYGACSGDKDEYNDAEGTVTKDCKLIKDDFKDGTEYAEKDNSDDSPVEVIVAEDNKDCFNSASSLVASAAVVAAAVVALF